jgi:hypothetical protein
LSNNQIPGHLFEAVIISTETNYDDQFKINKMLKNKIERIKAKKHLMERKNAWKEKKKIELKLRRKKKIKVTIYLV